MRGGDREEGGAERPDGPLSDEVHHAGRGTIHPFGVRGSGARADGKTLVRCAAVHGHCHPQVHSGFQLRHQHGSERPRQVRSDDDHVDLLPGVADRNVDGVSVRRRFRSRASFLGRPRTFLFYRLCAGIKIF